MSFLDKLRASAQKLMAGRHGADELSMALLIAGLALSIIGSFTRLGLLALLSRDSVVVASALSLVAALGDLMPPTALAGIFAAQVVDEPNYFKILRKCLLPAFVLDVWGILIIIYSNNVAALIK